MLGPLDVAFDVIDVLDGLAIDYVLGGSLASSTFGEPRATNDVDVAVALTAADLAPLSDEFRRRGYNVPDNAAAEAVSRRSSFNVVHPSGLKVDLFVIGDGLLDELQMRRRVRVDLPGDPPQSIWVTSPGDQILRKLDWYRLGQQGFPSVSGATSSACSKHKVRGLRSRTFEETLARPDSPERALQAAGVQP